MHVPITATKGHQHLWGAQGVAARPSLPSTAPRPAIRQDAGLFVDL